MPSGNTSANIPDRKNLVIGLGRTGLSCVRHLLAAGEAVAVTDSRREPPGLAELARIAPDTPRYLGSLDPALALRFERVVLSPGVARTEPLVRAALERGLPVVGDVELFARLKRAPAVGVTGTNGKSTVTALLAAMATTAGRSVRAGANLGEPALDLLGPPEPDLYVLELSSFQLESTDSLELAAAAVLNVTPDHLDRYPSLEAYAAAKARVYARAAVAVVNADDRRIAAMPPAGLSVVSFSLGGHAADWVLAGEGSAAALARGRGSSAPAPVLPLGRLKLAGRHNAGNALAALALGTALDLPLAAMLAALETFSGLPHRTETVGERGGVRFVDDSKGTNVGATLAAVAGLDGPLVVIAGGDGKGQDFAPLAAAFKAKVRHVVLIGRDAPRLAAALKTAASTEIAADMPAAVAAAARAARPGDVVLLSPACASLDMYRDYAHRGQAFAAAVRELPP